MNPVPSFFAQSFYSNVKKYLQFGQKMRKVLLACIISPFNPTLDIFLKCYKFLLHAKMRVRLRYRNSRFVAG